MAIHTYRPHEKKVRGRAGCSGCNRAVLTKLGPNCTASTLLLCPQIPTATVVPSVCFITASSIPTANDKQTATAIQHDLFVLGVYLGVITWATYQTADYLASF